MIFIFLNLDDYSTHAITLDPHRSYLAARQWYCWGALDVEPEANSLPLWLQAELRTHGFAIIRSGFLIGALSAQKAFERGQRVVDSTRARVSTGEHSEHIEDSEHSNPELSS